VLSLAWPTQCAVCRAWSAQRLCPDCVARFAPPLERCRRCAIATAAPLCADCVRDPPPFEHAVAAVDYVYPWDGLVGALKFRRALDLAGAFARLLASAARRAGVPRPALLVPMPLGPQRLRERGYNQAWELARRVGRQLGIAADARVLTRLLDTPHQTSLPKERRAANVRGSFALADPRRVRGATVALVDDVMTTGATAREAAQVLRDAGASQVQVWVFARTPPPDA
jgi:ComF family protein